MTTDNRLHADIHTLLGLIAGFRESSSDEKLLGLLIEQLNSRRNELSTTATNNTKSPPQDLRLWIAETEFSSPRWKAYR